MKTKIFVILLLLSLCLGAKAAPEKIRFRHYQVEDGLPSNSVMSMSQDLDGRIWIGTGSALCCFYGNSFRIVDEDFVFGIINTIHVSGDNTKWIGTDTGLYFLKNVEDTLVRFSSVTADGIAISSQVMSIGEDINSNLWAATSDQGIFKYDFSSGTLKNYYVQGAGEFVSEVFVDSDNNIWALVMHPNTPLARYNKNLDKFEPFEVSQEGNFSYDAPSSISEDADKMFWIGTWDNGLYKVDKYARTIKNLLNTDQIQITHIHYTYFVDKNRLFIGSDSGLGIYNIDTEEYSTYLPDENNPYAISNNFIYPIIKDFEGGIWIGTYHGGLNYISPNNGFFEGNSCTEFTGSQSGSIVSRFCEGRNSDVWIATEENGLIRYFPHSGEFKHYLPDYNLHALCFVEDELWIGTYAGGLNIMDLNSGIIRAVTWHPTIFNWDIYSIYRDRNGDVWLGSMRGIIHYDFQKKEFSKVYSTASIVTDIIQDSDGNVWFTSLNDGILKYSPADESWRAYTSEDLNGSLPCNIFNSIYIDQQYRLWAGSSKGLVLYDTENDCFEKVNMRIPSNDICCVTGDGGYLWLTTSKGLVRYEPFGECLVYTRNEGLQSDQFMGSSGMKTSDGKIYFGTANGFNSFYPHNIVPNNVIPKVVITGVEILDNGMDEEKDAPEQIRNGHGLEIELSHSDNAFRISYASLSFADPDKNQYAFMMDGIDKDWNYVGNQGSSTYTGLPAGTYIFKVKGTNNDGLWSENIASIKITIHPKLLLSKWFLAMYAFLALVMAGLIILFFVKRARKMQMMRLQESNQKREKEIYDSKIQFFTAIAHEIRTPVSLIIGPLEKIMSKEEEIGRDEGVKNDLNIVYRNAGRLLSLVNQLLDFRKIEHGLELEMRYTRQNIPALINSIVERFRISLIQRGETLIIVPPEEGFEAVVDSEGITKIMSNLLSNAGKYAKNYIEIKTTVHYDEGCFKIIVSNNGDEIRSEEKAKIFEPFYQTSADNPGVGIGLSIVKIMVEVHHGKIEVNPVPEGGTSFVITLPLSQEGYVESDDKKEADAKEALSGEIISAVEEGEGLSDKPLIMVVEDTPDMLDFLFENLSEDYLVIKARNGVEALEHLKSSDVSMIVCDWLMPEMNGIELCKAVRDNQFTSHIPFILLTAKTDMESKIESMEYGVDAYIEKPFSVQYLKACIKNMMDLRQMMIQKFSKMPLVPLSSIAPNKVDEQLLIKVNDVIEKNFSNPDISVDFVAEKLCISRSGLFSKIRTLTNVTPNELIQIIRLKKAAELLLENKYMVSEISYMVGFRNPSYFSKCFLKQFGVSPVDFGKSKENENQNDED